MEVVRSKEWYEHNADEITDIVQGEIVTRCCSHNGRLILLLSNGNELQLYHKDFDGWQLAMPIEPRETVRQIQGEKERFANALEVLVNSFNRRVDAIIEGVYVQHIPSPDKLSKQYIIDVNVSL